MTFFFQWVSLDFVFRVDLKNWVLLKFDKKIMRSASIEQEMPAGEGNRSRFENLRGVQWRIDLGILPCPSSSSVDDLRRVTANSRRR